MPVTSERQRTGRDGAEISADNYTFLQKFIHQQSGIVVDSGKHYLLESRLVPVLRQEGLSCINDLCALLRATSSLPIRQLVVEALTTNETLFCRDPVVFEALQQNIIPELVRLRTHTRKLRIWSAASSSGQEAYSLAMLLFEMDLGHWNIEIVGTDLNEKILERARTGKYSQLEVNRGLPVNYLMKYFQRKGLEWEISAAVRSKVQFRQFDLRQNIARLGRFDLVLCRNVLIYFDIPTKREILRQVKNVLAPDGLLLLGAAETTLNVDESFVRLPYGKAILYRTPST